MQHYLLCYRDFNFYNFDFNRDFKDVKQKKDVWIDYRWWLFRAWGRVGTTIGGNKVERYGSVDTLLEGFKQLYAEKTGNEWHNRKNFKKYPNKFYPLDIDYGQVS